MHSELRLGEPLVAPLPNDHPIAPAFTSVEMDIIAEWAATMRPHGVGVEIDRSHRYLAEALHIIPGGGAEPLWMLHKTPDGGVALRVWPGIADIVLCVGDGLGIVTRSIISTAVDAMSVGQAGSADRKSAGGYLPSSSIVPSD